MHAAAHDQQLQLQCVTLRAGLLQLSGTHFGWFDSRVSCKYDYMMCFDTHQHCCVVLFGSMQPARLLLPAQSQVLLYIVCVMRATEHCCVEPCRALEWLLLGLHVFSFYAARQILLLQVGPL
jgi:hypothetical protein